MHVAAAAGVPVEHLWAARGMLDEAQGLYDESRLAALDVPPSVRVTAVPDVNHYTVLLGPAGVQSRGRRGRAGAGLRLTAAARRAVEPRRRRPQRVNVIRLPLAWRSTTQVRDSWAMMCSPKPLV